MAAIEEGVRRKLKKTNLKSAFIPIDNDKSDLPRSFLEERRRETLQKARSIINNGELSKAFSTIVEWAMATLNTIRYLKN